MRPAPVSSGAREAASRRNPLLYAGLVLGLGMGGFVDGIVLHQILGWHHLVCVTEWCVADTVGALLRQNTQDGFFHLGLWSVTLAGAVMLFRAGRGEGAGWSGRVLGGAMVAGWGGFNFFEGLLNHQILGIHHVLPGSAHQFVYDMLFLLSGLVLGGAGLGLALRRRPSGDDVPASAKSRNG